MKCRVCYDTMIRNPSGEWVCRWNCDPTLAKPSMRRLHVGKLQAAAEKRSKSKAGMVTADEATEGLLKVDPKYKADRKRWSTRITRRGDRSRQDPADTSAA